MDKATHHDNNLPRPRGIYLLPNLFTTGALFAGFFSLISAINGNFSAAAVAVLVAGVLDGLDGRIARLTNTATDFGVQYDSLSDMVSFGLAPAIVMYTWALRPLAELGSFWAKLGWAAAFVYAACAALRLARFNTQAGVADKRYFQGLASPPAAGILMALVWTFDDLGISPAQHTTIAMIALGLTVSVALLMVSNVRYLSFKNWQGRSKLRFVHVLIPLLVLMVVYMDPPKVLLIIGVLYVSSGPVVTLSGRARARFRHQAGVREDAGSDP